MIEYLANLLILIGIYFILSISLQITAGFSGMFNMGHVGFFAIGAYTSALLTISELSFLYSFLTSGLFSMISGLFLSIPSRRLTKVNFTLLSISFSLIVYSTVMNWVQLTGGSLGLFGIPKPVILNISFSSNVSFLVLISVVALISFITIRKVLQSPFGIVLRAIKDDELIVRILGKNTFKMKSIALAFSAFFAGISGSLYAHYLSYINPSMFSTSNIVTVFLIVILGGLTSLRGTFIATVIIIFLPELIGLLDFPYSIVGPIEQFLYALILLIILKYKSKRSQTI